MTLEEEQARKGKTYKMLLWFGMISICMIFAGLTSAYVVSKSRPDWLKDFQLPIAFLFSTIAMLVSVSYISLLQIVYVVDKFLR